MLRNSFPELHEAPTTEPLKQPQEHLPETVPKATLSVLTLRDWPELFRSDWKELRVFEK